MKIPQASSLDRRDLLKGALSLATLSASTAHARPAPTLQDAKLLLGGSLASLPGQFGELAAPALSRGLDLSSPIQLQPDLAQDGVTIANTFDATETPDGSTAIAVSGAALLASLTGDARVHYDFGRWIPLLVARTATVVIGRTQPKRGLRSRIEAFFENRTVRVAVSRPTGAELSALLGLTLLGMHPTPVAGFTSTEQALAALRDGQVDAVQLSAATVTVPLTEVLGNLPPGITALYQTGNISDETAGQIPNFLETFQQIRHRVPAGPLFEAWHAASASTNTALTVALPMLTPPVYVAQWRTACANAVSDSGVRHWADQHHFSLATGENAAPLLSRATPPLSGTLALRRWIAINTPRWRLGQETRGLM